MSRFEKISLDLYVHGCSFYAYNEVYEYIKFYEKLRAGGTVEVFVLWL